MFDPISAPESLPLQSLKNLLSFAKGSEKVSQKTVLSGLTVVAYATKFMGLPEDGTPKGEAAPLDNIVDVLETVINGEESGAKGALIPWELIVAFIIKQVLKNLL